MTVQPQKRLALRWTAPRNLLVLFLFIVVTVLLQYFVVALTLSTGASDPTIVVIPATGFSVSLLFHVLPVAVVITLTTSFAYLTSHSVAPLTKPQPPRKPAASQSQPKPTRLRALRQLTRSIRRTARRVKQRVFQSSVISGFQRRMASSKAVVRNAVAVTATFAILVTVMAIAAYPHIVQATVVDLHTQNTIFHGFVMATIQLGQDIASAVPPIGVVATSINNAFLTASPGFRSALEGAASSLNAGLVAASPVEKYLVIQNVAAWTTAIVTILYRWYGKAAYRRW